MTRSAGPESPSLAALQDHRLRALIFFGAVAWMAWPLVATRTLPIEDLPQHVAAVRVLHSFHDARFGLERYFELSLGRTQYLAYYLLVDGLAYLLDLEVANRVVVVATVIATPYALAYLLHALGRERALALFALPLTYNAHLILGFINFLMAIPAALYGLALCVQLRQAYAKRRALLLACVSTFCFFCHVVPFAFLLLGAVLLGLSRDPRRTGRALLPLAPSLVIGGLWLAQSPAGQATVTAARGGGAGPQPQFQPAELAWRDLPNWLTDVLYDPEALSLLKGFVSLLVLAAVLGLIRMLVVRPWRDPAQRPKIGLALRLVPLAPLAFAAYFIAPVGYDWIWPIAQRFPLLALYFLVPVLPTPARTARIILPLLLLGLSARQERVVQRAFEAFDREEVGALDAALAVIPEGQKVCGLIWSRGSRYVKFSPFIHAVAYYQARKGGAVMFTFADFPPSPFRFLESDRPPRVPPRWEWLPQRVRLEDLSWYDYVLVRGGPDPCRGKCDQRYRDDLWAVWQLRK